MSAQEIFLTDRLKDCSWNLQHRQSAPFGRQGGQVITYGQPYWMASFRYENLSASALRALSAWIARRKGASVSFTAYRPARVSPANGATSNSGLGISAVSSSAGTIGLTGLSAALAPGDMVSYATLAGGYFCGEVVSAGAISTGAQTVTVVPAPVAVHGTPQARVYQAVAEFQLDGTPQITEPHDRRYNVSFSARQVEST